MTTNIFISYSRKNKDFAIQVVNALKSAGCEVWIDVDEIPPSAEWWSSIKQGIDEADSFVVILTPESLSSPVCTFEMDYAIKNNKRIIPLMRNEAVKSQTLGNIASVEPTGFLAEILGSADLLDIARDNWRTVEKLNWINVRESDNFDDNLRKLLAAVAEDPKFVQQHTRLLIRAREWNANGRKAAYALHGEDLHDAEIWLAASVGKQPTPTDIHTAYILASQEVRKGEQNRNRALTQARFGILLAIALLAILGFVFVNLRNGEQSNANSTLAAQSILANNNLSTAVAAQATSVRQADEAQSISWVANANERYAADDPFTALSLAIEANRIPNPPSAAQQLLVDLAYAPGVIRQFKLPYSFARIFSAAWNRDNQTFVTVGTSGGIFLWDINQEQPIRQFKDSDTSNLFNRVAWNNDGQLFLTIDSERGKMILWDKNQERPIRQFNVHDPRSYIASVTWSQDGQFFITTDRNNGSVFLWDKDQEQPVRQFVGHNSDDSINNPSSNESPLVPASIGRYAVHNAAWNTDGQFFVTVGDKGDVFLWNKDSEEPIREFKGHDPSSAVLSVAWNSDGQSFVTGDINGGIFLWNKENDKPIRQFKGHNPNASVNNAVSNSVAVPPPVAPIEDSPFIDDYAVISVVWNPDGQSFVTIGGNGDVFLWHKDFEGATRQFRVNVTKNIVISAAWNSIGQSFTAVSNTGAVFVLDVKRPLYQVKGFLRNINSVAWTSDGQSFVTAGDDGQLLLWDAYPKQLAQQYVAARSDVSMLRESNPVYSVAWNKNGQSFVTVGSRGDVLLWDKDQDQPIRLFKGHTTNGTVYSVAWNGDGQFFVTGGTNGEIFLWDKDHEQPIRQFKGHNPDSSIKEIVWNKDDQTFVSIGTNGDVFLWDKDYEQPIRQFKGHNPKEYINAVAWNKDGQAFVTVASDGEVFLWDKDSEYPIRQLKGHNSNPNLDGALSSVDWNGAGTLFVTAGSSGEVFMWDVNQDQPIRKFKGLDPDGYVRAVTWNKDGQSFVTVGRRGEVFLWNKDQDQPIRRFKGHNPKSDITHVAWNTNGQLFVTIGDNNEIFLWDKDQDQPVRQFKGQIGKLYSVAWNSDGKSFITVSELGEIYLWHVDTIDQVVQWTLANRFVPQLTCSQRTLYAVPPFCDEQGTPPVLTPYLTWTPSPSASATPTTDLTLTTATATPSITPTIPTWTPTATSNIATQTVQAATDASAATAKAQANDG